MEREYFTALENLYGYDQEEMHRFTGRLGELMGPEEAAETLQKMGEVGPKYAELHFDSRVLATLAGVKYYRILEEHDEQVLRRHLYADIQQFYDYVKDLKDVPASGAVEERLNDVMGTIQNAVYEIEEKYEFDGGEPGE